MALFLASRIIDNQTTYSKVPLSLKTAVAEILTQKGYANLITEG